jgi:hypothetical protein
MLYQRELALARSLHQEHLMLAGAPPELPPEARPVARWGPSYARHLGHVHGCREVALYVTMHLIPPVGLVHERLESGERVDLDAEEFYEVPELIGVFPCDAS